MVLLFSQESNETCLAKNTSPFLVAFAIVGRPTPCHVCINIEQKTNQYLTIIE